MKLVGLFCVVIMVSMFISPMFATEYTQSLPPNTILFDDFSEGLSYCPSNGTGYCVWYTQDNCGAVNSTCEVLLNNTVYWGPSGKSVEIRDHGSGSFGIEDFRRTFTYDHTHTISATFRFAFSCNMQANAGLQDIGFSLEYPDNSNPAQHQEFRVRYQTNQRQWQYKHVGIWSNIVFPAGTKASYPGVACTGANAPHYNYGWQFVTITGQPTSNTYISVQTPEGLWGCNGSIGLTSTCVPNNDESTDSSCGNSNINSCMAIETQIDGSVAGCTSNQSPINACQGFLGNVLVQDVTSGQPNIVNFGLVAFSGWFPVLMAAVGMMYGVSAFGLARRVLLGKTEGILQDMKMIFGAGILATVAFGLILVIGALTIKPACPPGVICNG